MAKLVSWLAVPSVHMLLVGAGLSAHMFPPRISKFQRIGAQAFIRKCRNVEWYAFVYKCVATLAPDPRHLFDATQKNNFVSRNLVLVFSLMMNLKAIDNVLWP